MLGEPWAYPRHFEKIIHGHIEQARPALQQVSGINHSFANILIAVAAAVSVIGLIPYIGHREKTGRWLFFNDKPKPANIWDDIEMPVQRDHSYGLPAP